MIFSRVEEIGKISDEDRYIPPQFYDYFGKRVTSSYYEQRSFEEHGRNKDEFCPKVLIGSLDTSLESILKRQNQFRNFAQNSQTLKVTKSVLSKVKALRAMKYPQRKAVYENIRANGEIVDYVDVPDFEKLKIFKEELLRIRDESLKELETIQIQSNPLLQRFQELMLSLTPKDLEELIDKEKSIDEFQRRANSLILSANKVDRFTGEIDKVVPLGYLEPELLEKVMQNLKNGEIPSIKIGDTLIPLSNLESLITATHDFRRVTIKGVKSKIFGVPEDPYSKLRSLLTRITNPMSNSSLINEIKFYCNIADFYQERIREGLPVCFPEILPSEANTTIARQFDPVWFKEGLERKLVDIHQTGNQIVTGLNSGGKSTYCRNIVFCKLWAQAGLPLPAQKAQVSISTGIGVINSKTDEEGNGIFATELTKIKNMYGNTDLGTSPIFILEEPFTGTDYESRRKSYERLLSNYATNGSTLTVSHEGEMLRGLKNTQLLKIENEYQTQLGIGRGEGERIMREIGF